jgi:protein TonB
MMDAALPAPAGARWKAIGARVVAALLIGAGLVTLQRQLVGERSHPLRQVQRVALVSSPRPPAPSKPVERPPEPKAEPTEIAVATEPLAQSPAPDPNLGVDAAAEGAGDSFGLVGKRGGRDITTIGDEHGSGTGAAGAPAPALQRFNHAAYAGLVRQRLQNDLQAAPELREHEYVSIVYLWIDAAGRVERLELQQSSGRPETDIALRRAFAALAPLPEPPPGLPQPLRLRVSAKDLDGRS